MAATVPQVEQTGESAPELHRSLPTPFLTKTYQLVEDPSIDDMISWNEDGSTFIVWKPAEFARDLLPKYFKHNNFSSFVRQLNTYGFRKVVPDRWEFAHESFKRCDKKLLRDIQRRKITSSSAAAVAAAAVAIAAVTVAAVPLPVVAPPLSPNSSDEQVLSSTSSPVNAPPCTVVNRSRNCTTTPELLQENARLRRENSAMSLELGQMRGMCSNVMAMMTNYAAGGGSDCGNRTEVKALDLLHTRKFDGEDAGGSCSYDGDMGDMVDGEVDTCPMLFGVSIGSKRVRFGDEDEGRNN